MIRSLRTWARRAGMAIAATALAAGSFLAAASEFSVSPIRVDLRPGALSETISVTNHAATRLRVAVKLMEWTQDAQGADVYKETGDLVYFPRQMDIEADSKRLVRVGAKSVAGPSERAYRLFIEEQPEPSADPTRAQIAFYFRFSVPVFVPPAAAKLQPEVGEPVLDKGKLSLIVRNPGNQHVRIVRITVRDEAGHRQEVAGWYLLAGAQRTYAAEIPREVCRGAKTLSVAVEGEGIQAERKLDVDPARCG